MLTPAVSGWSRRFRRTLGWALAGAILILFTPGGNLQALSKCQLRIHKSGIHYFNCDETRFVQCGTGGATNLVGSENAEKAWNFFIQQGFTPEQTAGILGNFQHESGMNPEQEQIGGPAVGLAQWEGGRRTNLESYGGTQYKTMEKQLEFVMIELNGAEGLAYSEIKKQTTVDGATINWLDYYERAGVRAESKRIEYANDFFARFGSNTSPSKTTSSGTSACSRNSKGEVVGNFSLPIDKSWFDDNPDWYTKPHHSGRAASDLPVPENVPVYSMSDGTVISAPNEGGYGLGVTIDYGNGIIFIYGHGTDGGSVDGAREGDRVRAGQVIMHSGNTGNSTGPHLHVEIQVNGEKRCPQPLFEGIRDNAPPDPASFPASGCTYGGGP